MNIIKRKPKKREGIYREAVYIKRGSQYVEVDRWEGFPAPGIWLVNKHSHGESATCIMALDDLADVYLPAYATAMLRGDVIVAEVIKHFDKTGAWSWSEAYRQITQRLCKGYEHPDKQETDKFVDSL